MCIRDRVCTDRFWSSLSEHIVLIGSAQFPASVAKAIQRVVCWRRLPEADLQVGHMPGPRGATLEGASHVFRCPSCPAFLTYVLPAVSKPRMNLSIRIMDGRESAVSFDHVNKFFSSQPPALLLLAKNLAIDLGWVGWRPLKCLFSVAGLYFYCYF